MENRKLLLVLLLPVVLLLALAVFHNRGAYSYGLEFVRLSEVDSYHAEEYCFEVEDGYAVTGYTGFEKNVVIPAEYQGKPVVAITDAFTNNATVASVSIPKSIVYIGDSAFNHCIGLTKAKIPKSVIKIGVSAFGGCTGLTKVKIPDSVTEIEAEAFSGCTGLTELIIPDSVTEIRAGAFSGCTGLTKLTIPDSVTEIGVGAFSGCTGLTEIAIPDSITEIGAGTFSDCTGLTEVSIPNSVTEVGADAFSGCTGLMELSIPGSVTEIGARAFDGCSSLANVTLENGVTQIGIMAFAGCALTEIVIPDSLTSYESAFDVGVILKTKMYLYLHAFPIDEVLAQAAQHLGEDLQDECKLASSDQLSAFGDRMIGLFVSLDNYWRPDIESYEYNAEVLSGRPELVILDLDDVPKEYLDAMLTAEKTVTTRSGEAEIVYALIECMGYNITQYRNFYYANPNLYHEIYRISFWSLKGNALLGWYQWETGFAPDSYWSDQTDTVYFIDMNNHKVCREKDGSKPDPLLDSLKALYGG